jgi:PAS domain S-box-containing protein
MVPDKLWRAVEQTADSVVITNRDGVIEYVNPAFEAMAGFTRDEAIGRKPSLLRSGVQTSRYYETLWSTILSGNTFHTTLTNRKHDGGLFEEEQTITPVRDEAGAITHFVSTGRDITQRKRAEAGRLNRQLRQEATRIASFLHDEAGQFLALAHITLADVSRGAEPALRERLLEVRRYLDHVEERLSYVPREMQPRGVEDLGLVDAITSLAEGCVRRTGTCITIESSLDLPCPAAVETLVYRFVQEGLTNMSRYARAPSAVVVLGRERGGRRAGDSTVYCSIRDDGTGFDVDALPAGGQGLRNLQDRFEAVGGTLVINSAPGEGTELLARMPVAF